MTRDDIIPSRTDVMSMAREAGFYVRNEVIVEDYIITEELESFAALIASRVAAKASAAAKAEEREACIEIVDINGGSIEIVAAIRARNNNVN